MLPNLFPTIKTPIAPAEPDTPYTGLLVWLSFGPRISGSVLDVSVSVRALPYRILKDGTIDQAPERAERILNVGSVAEAAKTDPLLAKAMLTIASALQTYISESELI